MTIPGSELFTPFPHGCCAARPQRLGLPRDFKIYDADDQTAVVKLALDHLNIKDPGEKIRGLLERISFAKNHGQTPAQVAAMPPSAMIRWASRHPKCTANTKIFCARPARWILTICCCAPCRCCSEFPEARANWQNRFRYIHVDEYQDTNRVQYDLLRLLVNESRNLCVVGDEDQSIYRWRGADIGNILRFEEDYPGARVVRLEENYRSTQKILDAAAGVVANNQPAPGQESESHASASGSNLAFFEARDSKAEAEYVADRIRIMHGDDPAQFILPFCTAPTRSRARLKKRCARAECATACWAAFRFTSAPK